MTYLNMRRSGGNKKKNRQEVAGMVHQSHHQPYNRGGNNDRRVTPAASKEPLSSADQVIVNEIDRLNIEGHRNDITQFFANWTEVPEVVGDWKLRVNVRMQDDVPVSRTVVALPLTPRTQKIFEKGCLAILINAGYSEDDAMRYYRVAWQKKYVWLDSVIAATKEMIDAFQTTAPLEKYELSRDPRLLAATVSVPKNPHLTMHTHFRAAIDMAKCIIASRQGVVLSANEPILHENQNDALEVAA